MLHFSERPESKRQKGFKVKQTAERRVSADSAGKLAVEAVAFGGETVEQEGEQDICFREAVMEKDDGAWANPLHYTPEHFFRPVR